MSVAILVFGFIILVRALIAGTSNGGTNNAQGVNILVTNARQRTNDAPFYFYLVCVATPCAVLILWGLVSAWKWSTASGWSATALVGILALGSIHARLLTIPFGWCELSYFLCRTSVFVWWRDRRAGALVAAALAAQNRKSKQIPEWVRTSLGRLRPSASSALANGLVVDMDGGDAEPWMHLALAYDERIAPDEARRIALRWLVTNYASKGEWKMLNRLIDDEGRDELRWLRLRAKFPGQGLARALVERIDNPEPEPGGQSTKIPTTDVASIAKTMRAISRVSAPERKGSDLLQLDASWRSDEVQDFIYSHVEKRLAELQSGADEYAVFERADESFRTVADGLLPQGQRGLSARAELSLHSEIEDAFLELGDAMRLLGERCSPSPEDEWADHSAWAAILRAYFRICREGDRLDEADAVAEMFFICTKFANRHWNDSRWYSFANAAHRFLANEAERTQFSDLDIALSNLRLGG